MNGKVYLRLTVIVIADGYNHLLVPPMTCVVGKVITGYRES